VQAGQARWAEVAGPDPATRYLAPGNPWQTTFTGGQEGAYTATGDEKGFILDSTPPGQALTLASAPPFGYIVTGSVYYGLRANAISGIIAELFVNGGFRP
jgi:hypothetical protein